MKHILTVLVFISISLLMKAQPWIPNLVQGKKISELTLKDYQKAFKSYWKPFNLERGYYIDANNKKRKATGWNQFKRWEWYMENLVDANTGAFPTVTANEVITKWRKSNPREHKSANWQVVGPNQSGGGYAGIGRLNCIAFHPTDNDTYWVGAPAGGLWVTTNNGSTWNCLTDQNEVLGISDIFIPTDFETSNTIYIATGDRDHWDNNSVGVLKSTNGGINWENTDLTFSVSERQMVSRLLVDPNDDDIILAATTDGLYKTTDAGLTWGDQLTDISFIDMEYKPTNFDVLYGSTKDGHIYVSRDGGGSWIEVLSTNQGRIELAVSPAADHIVYAIAADDNNGMLAIYKSTSSGGDFEVVYNEKNLMGWYLGGSDDIRGQGSYDLSLAVSPENANIVLIGGINTWRSLDGGKEWKIVNHWYGGFGAQAVHADKHMLKYRSNNDLFECNDGGVYMSDKNGDYESWRDLTDGMEISQIYKLGVSATSKNQVILGLQDNGSKEIFSSGMWDDVLGGDGMECLIDYTDNSIQYGTSYYGKIYRTNTDWSYDYNITPSGAEKGAWVTPYIIDPVDPHVLYAGYANVWKTTNRGDSWVKISSINTVSKLRNLAIAPSNSQVLYASDLYKMWRTVDGGKNWNIISRGLPSNKINYIAVKQNDPNTVWVALAEYDANGVYETTDGGKTWSNISAGLPELPITTIVQNKWSVNKNHLYVGTLAGVFIKDGDTKWESYNMNFPNVFVSELEIYYDEEDVNSSLLYAATFGRGLWKSPLYMVADNPPVINTVNASNIGEQSAELNASILTDFGASITESGFILSTVQSFDYYSDSIQLYANQPVINDGNFSVVIDDIDVATTYFFRAYAINEHGIGYGAVRKFTTKEAPFYTIRFNVTEEGTGNGVSGVTINIGDSVLITDVSGWAQVLLTNGTYKYSVIANDFSQIPNDIFIVYGRDFTVNIIVKKVGLLDLSDSEISLYPNPITSQLSINIKGVFNAEIFDVSGKSVMQRRIYRHAVIETNFLLPGIYFIHFENKTHKAIRKIIIQ